MRCLHSSTLKKHPTHRTGQIEASAFAATIQQVFSTQDSHGWRDKLSLKLRCLLQPHKLRCLLQANYSITSRIQMQSQALTQGQYAHRGAYGY